MTNEEMTGDERHVVQCSLRVYKQDREAYLKIKEETGLPTDAQVFAQLVQTFYDPVRVKDETGRLQSELSEATEALRRLHEEFRAKEEELAAAAARAQELEQLLAGAENRAAEEANRLQLEYEGKAKELEERHALKKDEYRMTIPADYYRALQLVAERESKRRGQEWTPSHVVSFFIYSRFIKGNLNGDLKSLSDSELRRAGIGVQAERKEVDL